jgi:hypothetical protein
MPVNDVLVSLFVEGGGQTFFLHLPGVGHEWWVWIKKFTKLQSYFLFLWWQIQETWIKNLQLMRQDSHIASVRQHSGHCWYGGRWISDWRS